jgi:histidinol dehydrogenase
VADILADVRHRGDVAVIECTARFDGLQVASMADLELTQADFKAAFDQLPAAQRDALERAARRVRTYHEAQKKASGESWTYRDEDGTLLGQKVTPLGPRRHLCARRQGGLPVQPDHERGAGPCGRGGRNHHGRANTGAGQRGHRRQRRIHRHPRRAQRTGAGPPPHVAGVTRAFTIGGAQAVAALAYGTETVPKVDKITGPGNAYVASAKKRVFGTVGIDMIAGPSEILVLADGSTPADWVAMDLFSQAEHDELAQSILLCPDAAYIEAVQAAIDRLLPAMPRRQIIARSLNDRGALILTRSMEEACQISNRIAPEHLEGLQPRSAPLGAPAAPRRCDLPGRLHQRKPGRLLRGPQPRPAHQRHRPFQLAAGGLRLPETQQPDRGQRTGRAAAGPDRR